MGKPFGSALELKEVVTPAGNPPAGSRLLYVKSDGKLYEKDSGGVETEVGGSAPWTAYTPTWAATGTAPAIGNGTLAGRYAQQGKVVNYEVLMLAGTTTTFGTGTWTFTLPVTGRTPTTFRPLGTLRMVDTSATAVYNGFLTSNNGTTVAANTSASPGASVGGTIPFAWASTDYAYLAGSYEAA